MKKENGKGAGDTHYFILLFNFVFLIRKINLIKSAMTLG